LVWAPAHHHHANRGSAGQRLEGMSAINFASKAFEKYFYDFSLYDTYFNKYIKSRGQYIAL
jgi:hypothetical protein